MFADLRHCIIFFIYLFLNNASFICILLSVKNKYLTRICLILFSQPFTMLMDDFVFLLDFMQWSLTFCVAVREKILVRLA